MEQIVPKRTIDVIIPAHNEVASIVRVVKAIPHGVVREVVVVDNCSTDGTGEAARQAGATVLSASKKGYGFACLTGINYLATKADPPEILVFMDGDFSDYPEELPKVVAPIENEGMDLVIGSRVLGKREKGSLTPQQVFGNWLATKLVRLIYGVAFTDLGPFRAIRFSRLLELNMQDQTFGWTVEMQVKAAKHRLKTTEVAVDYRKRIGISKVSGTVSGTFRAGYMILWTIFKLI